jgi:hypothetical protein
VSGEGTGAFHGGILGRATLGVPGFGLELSAISHVKRRLCVVTMHKFRKRVCSIRYPCPMTAVDLRLNCLPVIQRLTRTASYGLPQPVSRLHAYLTRKTILAWLWLGNGTEAVTLCLPWPVRVDTTVRRTRLTPSRSFQDNFVTSRHPQILYIYNGRFTRLKVSRSWQKNCSRIDEQGVS